MQEHSSIPLSLCQCGCGQYVANFQQKWRQGHNSKRIKPLSERFWEKVKKTDSCWLWIGSTKIKGYGRFAMGGKYHSAHRISWEMANGPIPDGLHVLHNCPGGDNPSCVNPTHLWLGTNADNMADMAAKGTHWVYRHPERIPRGDRSGARKHPERMVRGSNNKQAKLSEADVVVIRRSYANGTGIWQLSRQYGVAHSTMRNVVIGATWRHVPTP